MRKVSFLSFVVMLFFLAGCSLANEGPVPVEATHSEGLQLKNTSQACGVPDTLLLATTAGDMDINYCGPLPCFIPQPEWGQVIAYNYLPPSGIETQVLELNLAWGWYVSEVRCLIGDNNAFNLDANSAPIIEPYWANQTIFPVEPTAYLSQEILSYPACSMLGFCIKVYKKDFLGGLDAASERTLWVYNQDWNNPAKRGDNTPSPLLMNLCPKPCPVNPIPESNLIL